MSLSGKMSLGSTPLYYRNNQENQIHTHTDFLTRNVEERCLDYGQEKTGVAPGLWCVDP